MKGLSIFQRKIRGKATTVRGYTHPLADEIETDHEKDRVWHKFRKGYVIVLSDFCEKPGNVRDQSRYQLIIEERGTALGRAFGSSEGGVYQIVLFFFYFGFRG